jgi:hypothetical protein
MLLTMETSRTKHDYYGENKRYIYILNEAAEIFLNTSAFKTTNYKEKGMLCVCCFKQTFGYSVGR